MIAGDAGSSHATCSARGKSGQHRAGCWLTARRREPMESATENTPPMVVIDTGKGEKVR